MRCPALILIALSYSLAYAQAPAQPAAPAVAQDDENGGAVTAQSGQATSAPSETITGPLRAELTGLAESRRWFVTPPKNGGESELMLQMRLCGEGLADIARAGRPIFTEALDDSGQSLLRPEGYSEQEKTETFRIRASPESLRERGLAFSARLLATGRSAKSIKSLKGTVRILKAGDQTEEIVISNPLQFRGKKVEHARLAELGIEVSIVGNERIPNLQPGQNVVAVETGAKMEQIRAIDFHDAWLTKLRYNPRNAQTTDGKPMQTYTFADASVMENMQLVISIWPKIEDTQLPIEIHDVKLP